MELKEARERFVQAWGTLGSNWGINRTMAQIHALLLVSPDPLSTEEIMEELSISRGNANMTIRTLIDWGLVQKEFVPGERKEYFIAEKDIWLVFKQVVKERRKRELEPIFKVLEEVKKVKGDRKDKKVKTFVEAVEGIDQFAHRADIALDKLIRADEHWFVGSVMKLIK